ncbi:MAG: hypothetical protein GWN16_02940, partial [Calditrichae bacterium]|nr:hypothetical protein [Calditrichia bacterium]NIW78459.1 hypothetical protein [Calditrichia bacterium]
FLVEYKGDYWIHSITLGAFDVLAENDGAKFILNDLSGINIIDPATHQPLQPEEAFSLTPIDNFITDIKTYVEKE